MRVAPEVKLTESQRATLVRMSKARSSSIRGQERAQIILLAAEGLQNQEISQRLGQDRKKVGRWRVRFAEGGIEAILKDKTRPGRIKPIPAATRSKIIKLTTEKKPAGHTNWSRTTMAREVGVSPSTVGRVWAAAGLKPHRIKSFKLSNDKYFEEKLEDIIGLYLSPPEHAIVLSCDEKSRFKLWTVMHRSSDTFHKTDLTALENPSFSNEKADWMDAEWEQGGAMGCIVLCNVKCGRRRKTSRHKTQEKKAWGVLRAGQALGLLRIGNPGRCPGLGCFAPLGRKSVRIMTNYE